MHTKNIRVFPASLLGAMLWLVPVSPLVFSACDAEPVKVSVTMEADYSQIIEAIQGTSQTLTAKMALIESALSQGFADDNAAQELLRQAYDAALTLADRLGCASVAFPLMAAGTYGFPHELALSVAIRAFTDFLLTHEMQITLTVFGEEPYSLACGLFGDLRSFVDANYVEAAEKTEYDDFAADVSERSRKNGTALAVPFRPAANRKAMQAAQDELRADAEAPFLESAALARKPAEMPHHAEPIKPPAPPKEADDLESFLRKAENTFSEHLLDLLNECGEKDSDVYRRAEISRQLFHKIISRKDYQPTKSTAIQLALGLRLDLAETQKLLHKAGYALTRSSKTDLVVQYFIERGEYNIVVINTALFDCGLPLLKTGSAS